VPTTQPAVWQVPHFTDERPAPRGKCMLVPTLPPQGKRLVSGGAGFGDQVCCIRRSCTLFRALVTPTSCQFINWLVWGGLGF
jgi:hypothetical protein